MARAAAAPSPAKAAETAADTLRTNFQGAATHLGLDPEMEGLLATPFRELRVDIPIRMDNGAVKVFVGYRVQHNCARGPSLGGIRFHPGVRAEQVRALAAAATWRAAVAELPFGGAQGGISVDTAKLSLRELERLTRRYISRIQLVMGPYRDIPAPDVKTDSQTMAWIFDEYSAAHGYTPACVTGKPVEMGGSLGRSQATGRGVALLVREAATDLGAEVRDLRVAVQGFGKVGAVAAQLLCEMGARVVAVCDTKGGVENPRGLDVAGLRRHAEANGTVIGAPGSEPLLRDEVLTSDCDVLIPAALECAITPAIAARVKAKLIVEGASLPTTPAADAVLESRGVTLVPDIVAGAGGVIGSYFEWAQNLQQVCWDEDLMNCELEKAITRAYRKVVARAKQEGLTLRTAAYCTAIERVARAEKLRAM